MTKLSASLPKGQANGLEEIAAELVNDPKQPHVLIVVVDCKSIVDDVDSGDRLPTARIRQLEVVRDEDARHAIRLLSRATMERTGQTVLDIETEDSIQALFDEAGITEESVRKDADGDPDGPDQSDDPDRE